MRDKTRSGRRQPRDGTPARWWGGVGGGGGGGREEPPRGRWDGWKEEGPSLRRMKVNERTRLFGVDRHFRRAVFIYLFFSPSEEEFPIIVLITSVIDLCSLRICSLKRLYIVSLLPISRRRQEPEAPVLKCTSFSAQDPLVKTSPAPHHVQREFFFFFMACQKIYISFRSSIIWPILVKITQHKSFSRHE